jgi:hypothetical protein
MKQLIRRLATLAAVTGGAIFVRWWLIQQDNPNDDDHNNPPPPPTDMPPPPDMSALLDEQELIVLPPEAFAGTPTTGTYIIPNGNGNGALHHQDDLTTVQTITPEIAEALHGVGIANFITLAHANPTVLYEQLRGTFTLSPDIVEAWIVAAQEHVTER